MKTIYNFSISNLSDFLKNNHFKQITEDEALSLKRKPKENRLLILCYRKDKTVSSTHLHITEETPEKFIYETIPYINKGGSYEFFLVPKRFTEMKKLSEASSSEMKLDFLKKNAELIERPELGLAIPGKSIVKVEQHQKNIYIYYVSVLGNTIEEMDKKCSYYALDNSLM